MNLPITDSLVYSTVDTNMVIFFYFDISRHPGRGLNPLPCQRHHRSLIVELVASSPGHTTGDHRRRHGTHARPLSDQRKQAEPEKFGEVA